MKLKIVDAYLGETNLFERNTEDGPVVVFDYFVVAVGEDGAEYSHFKCFEWKADAEKLMQRVLAAKVIDPQYWAKVPERMSLEEEFAPFGPAWQFEQDMYRIYGI
jgi:hypothetical protein